MLPVEFLSSLMHMDKIRRYSLHLHQIGDNKIGYLGRNSACPTVSCLFEARRQPVRVMYALLRLFPIK